MNLPVILFVLFVTITSNQFLDRIKAYGLPCIPCKGEECDYLDESCEYGTFKNYCGRKECKKGLNKTCGGFMDFRGRCADGLTCDCHKCTGCILGECYNISCHMENLVYNPYSVMNPGRPMGFPFISLNPMKK